MEYCEEFLSRITWSRYPEVYEDLDIEKMRRIICENIDHLIRLKGEKAVEEMINNDVVTIYFRRLFLVKEILDIPKEFLTYIYLIREKFGKKILKRLIRILRKFEDLYQINTMSIIETIGKNIENLDKERIKVLLETLAYLIKEKYKLRIVMHTALSESLNLIVDKDIDIKTAKDFIIKVIGSFRGNPYHIRKLKDKIPKEKFVKLLNIFSSNGLYYKVQNEEDLILILNQIVRNPSIIDLMDNINFEKIKARDFLFILTKYFENIYLNDKINQEIKLEIFNQLINKGGRNVRYIIIHTDSKRFKFEDYDRLYNVINLMGKDLFTKYPNILKYYPLFVSFRLYRLINSEKDLEYLEEELAKRDPYELICDSNTLKKIYEDIYKTYAFRILEYLTKALSYIVEKYGKRRKLIVKILDAFEEIKKFDKYVLYHLLQIFVAELLLNKDNIGKIEAWCNYFSDESVYYKCIYKNIIKKFYKMDK